MDPRHRRIICDSEFLLFFSHVAAFPSVKRWIRQMIFYSGFFSSAGSGRLTASIRATSGMAPPPREEGASRGDPANHFFCGDGLISGRYEHLPLSRDGDGLGWRFETGASSRLTFPNHGTRPNLVTRQHSRTRNNTCLFFLYFQQYTVKKKKSHLKSK